MRSYTYHIMSRIRAFCTSFLGISIALFSLTAYAQPDSVDYIKVVKPKPPIILPPSDSLPVTKPVVKAKPLSIPKPIRERYYQEDDFYRKRKILRIDFSHEQNRLLTQALYAPPKQHLYKDLPDLQGIYPIFMMAIREQWVSARRVEDLHTDLSYEDVLLYLREKRWSFNQVNAFDLVVTEGMEMVNAADFRRIYYVVLLAQDREKKLFPMVAIPFSEALPLLSQIYLDERKRLNMQDFLLSRRYFGTNIEYR